MINEKCQELYRENIKMNIKIEENKRKYFWEVMSKYIIPEDNLHLIYMDRMEKILAEMTYMFPNKNFESILKEIDEEYKLVTDERGEKMIIFWDYTRRYKNWRR